VKVSVRFEGTGLQLRLNAENELEERMVATVLNHQPVSETFESHRIDQTLLCALVHYKGHSSNKRIEEVVLTVSRQEQPKEPT
jgi:hypothetical protein